MSLRHLACNGLSKYAAASKLQEQLVAEFLAHKATPTTSPPTPTIITAQFAPVYTCGRREIGGVTPEQADFLRADGRAEFHEARRGGQTTFHGPGQLVAYPIIDLKRHGLSPRCYVHMLEDVVMDTCKQYGIDTMRTSNPGVWVDDKRKICAVGVHLRRNVSSHGIGLNVNTDLWWFNRIVACGLEDKSATSFAELGIKEVPVDEVAASFVQNLMARLHGVDSVEREDVASSLHELD